MSEASIAVDPYFCKHDHDVSADFAKTVDRYDELENGDDVNEHTPERSVQRPQGESKNSFNPSWKK